MATTSFPKTSASVKASASTSVPANKFRRILKEQAKVQAVEPKRKLDQSKSGYEKIITDGDPPKFYTHVPVGTRDLADRCKELSQEHGIPIYIVNERSAYRGHFTPANVSFHMHRIGYHFRADLVEQACDELQYVKHDGKFVKPSIYAAEYKQDLLANILRKYNLPEYLVAVGSRPDQSLEQVRSAIKELFPCIPDEDLEDIVHRAWEKGTGRVGTSEELPLSRKVQLAVGSRIRHTYTDYDTLLRAFQWRDAREMVEKPCIDKLIEWRGESEDKEALYELVGDAIMVDQTDNDAHSSDEIRRRSSPQAIRQEGLQEQSHPQAGPSDRPFKAKQPEEDHVRLEARKKRNKNARDAVQSALRWKEAKETKNVSNGAAVHVRPDEMGRYSDVITFEGVTYLKARSPAPKLEEDPFISGGKWNVIANDSSGDYPVANWPSAGASRTDLRVPPSLHQVQSAQQLAPSLPGAPEDQYLAPRPGAYWHSSLPHRGAHASGQAEPPREYPPAEYDPSAPYMSLERPTPKIQPRLDHGPWPADSHLPARPTFDPRQTIYVPPATPVHGAPAPVQQAYGTPQYHNRSYYPMAPPPVPQQPVVYHAPALPPAPPPVNGAPAPTQYYHQR